MLKKIFIPLTLLASLFSTPPVQAQSFVVATCGVLPLAYKAGATRNDTVDLNGNKCISGSISASLSGFAPATTGTPITASVSPGATGSLPAGAVVVAFNAGTTNTAFCKLGASATTSDVPIPPQSWFAFTVGAATQMTCLTSASTTTVNMTGGSGLPTGAGGGSGGGGGGGAVTIADGANVVEGAVGDAASTAGGTGSLSAKLRLMTTQLTTLNSTLGTPFQAGGSISNTTFASTQSGTWTVQPGNTANTTAWLFNMGSMGGTAINSGCVSNYGTAPSAVACPSVNAFVTNGAGTGSTGSAVPGTSAYNGGRGSTSDPTAVTDGQLVGIETTPNGKVIAQPWALTPNLVSGGGSSTGTGTFTILAASGSASLKEYLTGFQCGRSDAGTTAITVAISDGTTTRTFVVPNNGGGGGNNAQLTTPIAFAANTAVTAAFSTGVTTGYCNAEGFYAP